MTPIRLPVYADVILGVGFVVWLAPFVRTGWSKTSPEKRDRRAFWGLALECVAYFMVWFGAAGSAQPSGWRVGLSVLFLECAAMLSWSSTRALGRFLRFEAALEPGHQLIRRGPYRIVRHPIYASMLCLFLGIATMVATPVVFAISLAIFVAGTEIRVRVEDGLLADRFGEKFEDYRKTTPAYVPFLR